LTDRIILHPGDCLDALAAMADASVDSCVTDPPYHLTSIVKRFGAPDAAPAKSGKTGAYARASRGFMGKQWDGGDIAFRTEVWAHVLRVLKPGGHLLAFSGTRTYHRMVCAIEDAGFEIRDQIGWAYGSGFPKSHDVSKGIDRAAGVEREMGPVDATRFARLKNQLDGYTSTGDQWEHKARVVTIDPPATDEAAQWQGWGTALKPAWESICIAQKPHVLLADFDTIGSQITDLESSLWSMLPANIAEKNFGLSRKEFDAACASARWNADEKRNTRDALSGAMGTARFVLALTSCLSTVSSWKHIWIESSQPANTFIIETELNTTIGLRTLKSLLSRITPESIMLAHRNGLWSIANASNAERLFDATLRRLSGILEHSALASAIEQEVQNSLGVDARPAWEPIVLARKPLIGTVAQNVLKHGTGAINIDGCRVESGDGYTENAVTQGINTAKTSYEPRRERRTFEPSKSGRWPANIVHDGSDEVVGAFPESAGGNWAGTQNGAAIWGGGQVGYKGEQRPSGEGSAARFFYTAKADADDRLGSKHPTVKPLDLMQWLVRLVTPPGGTVLDPFAGTGTTGEAAFREGFKAVLIEREPEYQNDIRRRIKLMLGGPDERKRESIKASGKAADAGPLFGGGL
jgi:DNA modification methylase